MQKKKVSPLKSLLHETIYENHCLKSPKKKKKNAICIAIRVLIITVFKRKKYAMSILSCHDVIRCRHQIILIESVK